MPIPGAQQIAASAYRTLGLSGSATQGQIDQAARKLRIWPDPKNVPPTPWDMRWLGPISRGKNEIEQALSRLSEPSTRITERLMWFNGSDPKPWSAAEAGAVAAIASSHIPADRHDHALYRLHMASVRDPNLTDPDQWHEVLTLLRRLAGSDEYLEWILEQENNGDFDKRARLEEIADALHELPNALTAGFVSRAEGALENDDFVVCGRVVELLRGSGPDADKAVTQILDRAEDLLIRRCMRLHEDLERQIRWGEGAFVQERPHNQKVCRELATVFNESVEPVITEWATLAPDEHERAERIRISAAKAQYMLARAWTWSGRFIIAERTIRSALEKARGSNLEGTILEELPNYTQRSRAELHGNTGTGQRTRVVTDNPSVRIKPRQTAAAGSSRQSRIQSVNGATAGIGGGAVLTFILLGRLLLTGLGSAVSHDSTNTGPRNPAPLQYLQPRNNPVGQSPNVQPWDQAPPASVPVTGQPAHSPPNQPFSYQGRPQPAPGNYTSPSRIFPSNTPMPPRSSPVPYGGRH